MARKGGKDSLREGRVRMGGDEADVEVDICGLWIIMGLISCCCIGKYLISYISPIIFRYWG